MNKLKDLKTVVEEYNNKNGYSNDDDSCYETFIEVLSKEIVQEETESEHRWYDIKSVIHRVEINGVNRYFKTFKYHITGDNSAYDMGLDLPTLKDVKEVFPKSITKTVYI